MADRIEWDELIRLVASRAGQDVEQVNCVVDAFLDVFASPNPDSRTESAEPTRAYS